MPSETPHECRQSERQFHHFHNDPDHTVIIASSDNVLFRTSRFRLTQKCQFFADLFSIPPTASQEERKSFEPIHLDFPSEAISIFLHIILTDRNLLAPDPKLPWEVAKSLHRLAKYTLLDDAFASWTLEVLEKVGHRHPLELLVFASDLNDLYMARSALSRATYTTLADLRPTYSFSAPATKFWEYLDRLRPSWQRELLQRIIATSSRGFEVLDDWTGFAQIFDPGPFAHLDQQWKS
ncbi:hypothetical protein IAT40_000914 [Kwoniella sp. CBS 6097]